MKKKSIVLLALTLSVSLGVSGCNKPDASKAPDTKAVTSEDTSAKAPADGDTIAYTQTQEANENINMMNKPESPYWFPAEFMEWNPSEDPDLALIKGNIPLAARVEKDKLNPVNETQNKDFKVANLSIMNASTSGNLPHGSNQFAANTFSYWQYIDQLVYWGGSSGEGLIVPPSADVIDAGHTNGVPVLGTIFFPMTEHGGKIQWLEDFLKTDDNGHFPIIDKLIEAAQILGFDGWFLNQESQGTKEEPLTKKHAELMQEFVVQYREQAGDSISLIWYDSMTEEGKMDWQNTLNDKNDAYLINKNKQLGANNMFLNFWWTNDSYAKKNLLKKAAKKAESLGLNPYDLYAGIDVQSEGYLTPVKWNLFAKDNVPYTSLGLYCPSWTYFSSEDIQDYENKEKRFWVNDSGDPSVADPVSDSGWHGISTYAIEKTVINSAPFITNFSLGNGYNFFIDGQQVSITDWNNRSITDIMPTYRWMLDQPDGNQLKPSFDYSAAYYGGNSIRLYGALEKDAASVLTLYSADLKVDSQMKAFTYVKADHSVAVDLVVSLSDGTDKIIQGDTAAQEEFTKISYDLSEIADSTIKTIGLSFTLKDESDIAMINLGNLSFVNTEASMEQTVSNTVITSQLFDDDGMYAGVKLAWDALEDADYYEIYKIYEDGSRGFLGVTTAAAHYIHALGRDDKEEKTTFMVIPVNKYQNRGTGSTVTMEWPNINLPKSDFTVSKTLCAPGEAITFTSLASQNTTQWEWTFEGADTPSSTDENPTVTYQEEGTYTVKLIAKNDEGAAEKEVKGMIQINKDAAGELPVLSLDKEAAASSFVNDNEAPKFSLDGKLDTKWCATGPAPHDITIDLGKEALVSEVYMAHAQAGGESADMNTMWYTIETSTDGKIFTPAIEVKNNASGETTDTFAPAKARYIKITAIKPTQGSDSAVRIYEIQIHGLE